MPSLEGEGGDRVEEDEDDQVEEVLPASSSEEEVAPANKVSGVPPPMRKKKSTAQPSETSEEIREKLTGLTVSKPEAADRRRGRTTMDVAASKSGNIRKSKTRSNSLGHS